MKTQKTWWGDAFLNSLINFIDVGRLQRGRAYQSEHRMLQFEMNQNQIKAVIRGNINPYFGVYKEPKYKVSLAFKKLEQAEWDHAIEAICQRPSWLAKLMLNELPSDIELAFNASPLIPKKISDMKVSCSCPDYANPCKHMAGLYYRVADLLDQNPMLLFPLHGLPVEDLQKQLQEHELGKAFSEHLQSSINIEIKADRNHFSSIQTTSKNLVQKPTQKRFWVGGEIDLEPLEAIDSSHVSLIKKQGDYPEFWERQNSFIDSMEALYQQIQQRGGKWLL